MLKKPVKLPFLTTAQRNAVEEFKDSQEN